MEGLSKIWLILLVDLLIRRESVEVDLDQVV
jgi:hypothetical protein